MELLCYNGTRGPVKEKRSLCPCTQVPVSGTAAELCLGRVWLFESLEPRYVGLGRGSREEGLWARRGSFRPGRSHRPNVPHKGGESEAEQAPRGRHRIHPRYQESG